MTGCCWKNFSAPEAAFVLLPFYMIVNDERKLILYKKSGSQRNITRRTPQDKDFFFTYLLSNLFFVKKPNGEQLQIAYFGEIYGRKAQMQPQTIARKIRTTKKTKSIDRYWQPARRKLINNYNMGQKIGHKASRFFWAANLEVIQQTTPSEGRAWEDKCLCIHKIFQSKLFTKKNKCSSNEVLFSRKK